MTNNLLLAILAMDAYNRGGGGASQGLVVDASEIGGATVDISMTDNATGFFAQAYDLNGQKIISYRGTDDLADVQSGWPTGGGAFGNPQGLEAAQFYQQVVAEGTMSGPTLDQLYSGNVWLTGHSLGGGLAGLIASVYGQQAVVFDSMAFSRAASNLYTDATDNPVLYDHTAKQTFFLGLGATPNPINGSGVTAFQVQGQSLDNMIGAPSNFTYSLGGDVPLSGRQLHSAALAVIAIYADDSDIGDDWLNAAQYVLPGLYDDTIASKLGIVAGGETGTDTASGKMRTMVAYSALDEGNVFGNTGIKAFLHDASSFGRLLEADNLSLYLQDASVRMAIGEIIAEYAGLLATNYDTNDANAAGVVTYTPGSNTLVVDFSHDRWTLGQGSGGTNQADVVGKADLAEAAIKFSGSEPSSVQQAIDTLWNGKTDNIIKLVAATTDPTITLDAVVDAGIGTDGTLPTDGAMLVAGGGGDMLIGSKGNNLLVGGAGYDTLTGGTGVDLMFGGGGKDTFNLGQGGSNWVDGGPGYDTAKYQTNDALTVVIANTNGVVDNTNPNNTNPPVPIIKINDPNGESQTPATDYLISVEDIQLGTGANTVNVSSLTKVPYNSTIDLGATSPESGDTVDFSNYNGPVYLSSAHPAEDAPNAVELYRNKGFGNDTGLGFTDFNTLILGNGANNIDLHSADDPYLTTVQAGNGNNTITSDIKGLKINLGTGNNFVRQVAIGTIVNAQSTGTNNFIASNDELITGSTAADQIFTIGDILLRGAVGFIGSEDPWVLGPDNTRYAINTAGDLVIENPAGQMTFVSGYQGGPSVPYAQQTDGIFLGLAAVYAQKLIDLTRPYIENVQTMFKLGNELLYTATGETFFNADPLVFDLTGTGINLTALSEVSPSLDMRGTGFAVQTGWIGANDGILVLQQTGESGTPTISEMFGGPGSEGFAALASYDSNSDGVIDANDPIYAQLRIWVDHNGNGAVDAGELETLQQAGIASISLTSTAQTGDTDAGNTITATGSFTRTDGSTGAIADVSFNVDTFHSQYLGDTSVSTAAAAMPNLKGYGTLTSLQIAMTLDPSLIDIVNANLPNLDVLDLSALRAAALPILVGWAEAVKLPDADGNLQVIDPAAGHSDVPILLATDSDGNVSVDDFGYQVTDSSGTYWKLASGNPVTDADGHTIDRPTFAEVMAQTPSVTGDSWNDLNASEIGFLERFYGQPFPIDQAPSDPTAMLSAMSDFINGAVTALDLEALRLAMQGPLQSYFPGVIYDPASDSFSATSSAQLTPMYEAIFNAAPADSAGAASWLAQWKPLIDIVLGDFQSWQPSGSGLQFRNQVTYGYQFASMVRAFEATDLPLSIADAAAALGVPAGEVIDGGSTLTGPDASSIFYLHGGDQTAIGGVGLNNFVMGGSFGHDTIIDDEPAPSDDAPSILRFTNVNSTDVTATRNGLDLILTVNGTDEQVTVQGEFTGVRLGFNGTNFNDNVGVAQIQFADGVLWDMPDIAWAVARPDPTDAVVLGTPGMDVLDGGVGGNNYLSGGDGSDIYLFGRGYGHDTIKVNRSDPFNDATDYLEFGPGITKSDLIFSRQGQSDDLNIAIQGTSDTLTILDQFGAGYGLFGPTWLDRIEGFTFADGSSYSWEDVIQLLDRQATGQPAIYGFDYADTLDGGPGVHYLSGGNEDDTYVFGFGDSFDTVEDATTNILSGMDDTIAFGPDVTEADVIFALQGTAGDLLVTLSDGSTLLIKDEFGIDIGSVSFNRIENFQFDDGTTLTYDQVRQQIIGAAEASSPVVIGTDYADVLDPGAGTGNHYLSGGNGADTYVFGHGYGHETVDVNWTELLNSGTAQVSFKADVSESDVTWTRLDQDLVIKLNGTNDSLTVLGQFAGAYSGAGIASFAFADGTTLTAAAVAALATAVNVNGTSSDDTIQSTAPDEVLSGGNGNDTYVYSRGDGFDRIEVNKTAGAGYQDTLSFPDIASTEVTLMRWPGRGINDLVIAIDGQDGAPQGEVTIANQFAYGDDPANAAINTITFADGVTWTEADTEAKLIAQEQTQGGANATIYGFGGADTLTARAGSSTLVGFGGADTYVWSAGDGATWISDQGDVDSTSSNVIDTLLIHGLDASQVTVTRNPDPSAHDLVLTSPGQNPIVLVNQTASGSNSVIERVVFDDGTTWNATDLLIQADGGIPAAPNGATARSFAGAAANSTLAGTSSDDTYFWGAGDGNDTIAEGNFDPSQKADALRLLGLNPDDVTFNIVEDSARDLLITNKATGETLTVLGQFYSASNDGSNTWAGAGTGLERIIFADGTIWNPQQILDHAAYLAATGATSVSNLDLGDGTLPVQASPGVTTLNGLGSKLDTYLWTPGDGSDTISDIVDNNAIDTLRLIGVAEADVQLARVGWNLVVTDTATGESITVVFEFPDATSGNGIEQIAFDDGTVWDRAAINANAEILGTPGDDTLNGTDDPETFDGRGGNDTLTDRSGASDTFIYRSTYGNETIDYQVFDSAHGGTLDLADIDPSGVTLTKDGNQLYITITATGKVIHDTDHFLVATRGIDQVQFADGTVWDRATIDGNAQPPAAGDYLLYPGTGQVTVSASSVTGTVRVPSGVTASDIILQADNSGNLTIKLRGASDSVTLTGDLGSHWWGISTVVANITFADGSTMALGQPDYQVGHPPVFTWIGGAGTTTLVGSNYGTNLFELGPGGDTITGGNMSLGVSGLNTFLFDKGDGHASVNLNGGTGVIDMAADVAASDVILQGDNSGDLTVMLLDTGDSITFSDVLTNHWWGISSVVGPINFADGTSLAIGMTGPSQGQPPVFTWIGTAGHTTLVGSNYGTNVFDLGPGGDTITGGNMSLGVSGLNTFLFDKGDGQAHVNLNGGTGVIDMAADVAASDVILQADNSGDLTVVLRDTGDSITFSGVLENHWWGISSDVGTINFADGTNLAIGMTGYQQGQPPVFTWIGTAGTTTLVGSNYGTNVFDLDSGGDTITGGNMSLGVSGLNTFVFDKGDGQASVNLNGGTGIIDMASDIAASDVILQADTAGDLFVKLRDASDSIAFSSDLTSHWWGTSSQVSEIDFADGTKLAIGMTGYQQGQPPTFTWIGTSGNDTLTGSAFGNNIFEGGAGNDTLNGNGGYDTYKFATGFGQTVVNNLASDGSGPQGEIDFGSGIAHDQLWLRQSGNDLQIDLLGTNEDVTVSGWYAGNTRAQVQSIDAGDGLKLDSQLQQLVGAMATYAANNPSFDPTQATQMPNDTTLQNAIATAWH